MVQAEALIPGGALLSIMLQTPGIITQSMQGRQLVIRDGRMLHQGMRLPGNRDYLHAVNRERQQYSRTPDTNDGHQCPGKGLLPRHTDAATTYTGTVIHDALPGCRQGQGMAL